MGDQDREAEEVHKLQDSISKLAVLYDYFGSTLETFYHGWLAIRNRGGPSPLPHLSVSERKGERYLFLWKLLRVMYLDRISESILDGNGSDSIWMR